MPVPMDDSVLQPAGGEDDGLPARSRERRLVGRRRRAVDRHALAVGAEAHAQLPDREERAHARRAPRPLAQAALPRGALQREVLPRVRGAEDLDLVEMEVDGLSAAHLEPHEAGRHRRFRVTSSGGVSLPTPPKYLPWLS